MAFVVVPVLVQAKVHRSPGGFKLGLKGGVLHVWLTEPAEQNRANRELLKGISKIFGPCAIVRGAASSRKVLEIPARSPGELKRRLESAYL